MLTNMSFATTLVFVAGISLFLVALLSILQTTVMTGLEKLLSTILVFVFPIAGPVVWFVVARPMLTNKRTRRFQ